MQMMLHQPADSALQVAGGIYQSEGMAGFWRGNGESELLASADPLHCSQLSVCPVKPRRVHPYARCGEKTPLTHQ